jgi:hypothetical protein
VKLFLANNFNGNELIYRSISCYNGSIIGCGQCRSCLRKYVALHTADEKLGQECREEFDHDPKKFLFDFLQESKQKGRDAKEIVEIEKALGK